MKKFSLRIALVHINEGCDFGQGVRGIREVGLEWNLATGSHFFFKLQTPLLEGNHDFECDSNVIWTFLLVRNKNRKSHWFFYAAVWTADGMHLRKHDFRILTCNWFGQLIPPDQFIRTWDHIWEFLFLPTDTWVPPEDVPVKDIEGEMSEATWDLTIEVLSIERTVRERGHKDEKHQKKKCYVKEGRSQG